MVSTCRGTDTHVAAGLSGVYVSEETGGVCAVELLSGEVTKVVPGTEFLNEVSVSLVVEEELGTGGRGVVGVVLLTHSDEPVGLGVITEGIGLCVVLFGVCYKDSLDLSGNLLKLIPSGGNGEVVLLEEGLVVVKNLSGLYHRKSVHSACCIVYGTFCIVAVDEVSDLLVGKTKDLAGLSINYDLALDEVIEGNNLLGEVVKSYVVRIAVSDVRLVACGKLLLDLVTNVVVTANLSVLNGDVGVDLVELNNVLVKNVTKSFAHGVREGNGNFATVVALSGYVIGYLLCRGGVAAVIVVACIGRGGLVTAEVTSEQTEGHSENEKECNDFLHLFFHPFVFLLFFKTFVIKTLLDA